MSTLDKNHNRMYFAFITRALNLHPVWKKGGPNWRNAQRSIKDSQSWLVENWSGSLKTQQDVFFCLSQVKGESDFTVWWWKYDTRRTHLTWWHLFLHYSVYRLYIIMLHKWTTACILTEEGLDLQLLSDNSLFSMIKSPREVTTSFKKRKKWSKRRNKDWINNVCRWVGVEMWMYTEYTSAEVGNDVLVNQMHFMFRYPSLILWRTGGCPWLYDTAPPSPVTSDKHLLGWRLTLHLKKVQQWQVLWLNVKHLRSGQFTYSVTVRLQRTELRTDPLTHTLAVNNYI